MKKKLLSALLCAAMVSTMLAGCGSQEAAAPAADTAQTETKSEAPAEPAKEDAAEAESAPAENAGGDMSGKTIAILVKSAGNPYNERQSSGFQEIIDASGAKCIVKAPESATAEAQITMINELVAQKVDAIAIAGNDFDALQPALTAAMNAGIKVCSFDSSVNKDSRMVHVNQAGISEIGVSLVNAVADIAGAEGGQFAILSATSQASNQNAWIAAMQAELEKDARGLELVKVAYGDDEFQKSVDETEALIKNYPDLKVICAPTTVGIMAAAKVVKDKGLQDTLKVTGLGLPSEMADYIGEDNSCPYMFLWNPIDIGRLTAYTCIALINGDITGAEGDTFVAGDLGNYTVVSDGAEGTEVILGPPFEFNPENIDEWKTIY